MNKDKIKKTNRIKRHRRIRAKIFGTKERPRVSVFKSNKHMFVQFIDDASGKTLLSNEIKGAGQKASKINKKDLAFVVGQELGKKALDAGIKVIVFDKGGFSYHGRIKSLADGLRKSGINF